MVRNVNVNVKLILVLIFPVNLSGDCQISSVGNVLLRICQGVEGVVGEVKSVSWVGAQTKGELTSVSSSLRQLFFTSK